MITEKTILLQYLKIKKIIGAISGVILAVWVFVSLVPFVILSTRSDADYTILLWVPTLIVIVLDVILALVLRSYKRKALMQIKALQNDEPHAPHPGLANPYQQQYQYAPGQPQAAFVLLPGQQYPFPNPPAVANEHQPQGQPTPAGWALYTHSNSALPQETAQVTTSP